jgi:hypothetical protein
MMIYLNVVIVFGYVVLTAMLFDHGTKAREPLIRRLKFASLAVAFMCFGIGRMSYTPGTIGPDEWIFNMGHVAFQTFGAVYFWTGYRMAHGETRARRSRRWPRW